MELSSEASDSWMRQPRASFGIGFVTSRPASRRRLATSPPGLAILSSLEVICETEERRRQFAELLFTRVTIDRYSRARDWALNHPFQALFEFAQPGSKLVLDGDPERTRGRKYHQH